MKIFSLFVALFSWIPASQELLTIKPRYQNIWLLEGSPISLVCEYIGPNEGHLLDFLHNNQPLAANSEYKISIKAEPPVGHGYDKVILKTQKQNIEAKDTGEYKCKYGDAISSIQVTVINVTTTDQKLMKRVPSVNLTCQQNQVPVERVGPTLEVEWMKNKITLPADDKYKVTNNDLGKHMLEIMNPGLSDAGKYQCVFVFNKGSSEEQKVTSPPAALEVSDKLSSGGDAATVSIWILFGQWTCFGITFLTRYF